MRILTAAHARCRQRGQAIVYVTAMLGVLALGLAYVFNAGQISNEKTRLQNTADAVAYSVAVVEARDLNFKAYTNRIMVANQIAVAQAVGMVSWLRWLDNTAQNLARVTRIFPYLNAATSALASVARAVRNVGEPIMQGIAAIADSVILIASTAQQLMHFATIGIAQSTLIEVAQANDPTVDTALSFRDAIFWDSLRTGHLNFTRRYDPRQVRGGSSAGGHRERMNEFRQVTLDSRDPFSRARNYRFGPRFTIPFVVRFEMQRRGGTELSGPDSQEPYYTWSAMDTLSLHASTYSCRRFRCRWRSWNEILPLGWGAAQASQQRNTVYYSRNRGSNYGGTWQTNPIASGLAAGQFQNARNVYSRYFGLRPFYDIVQTGLLDQAPGVKVLLVKNNTSNALRTMQETGFNRRNGPLDIESDGGMIRDRMNAVAKAVPYFSRPDDLWSRGAGGGREYGNAYNPYWQARLEKIEGAELRTVQVLARTL